MEKDKCIVPFLISPVFIIFFFYADVWVNTLFTKSYAEAIPLFRIYLILMLRKCFEMGSPLRAMNKNKYFVFGNILSLAVNVVALYILFKIVGFYGPAIAYVVTEISLALFLAIKILPTYKIKLSEMLQWKKIFIIFSVSLFGFPIFYLGSFTQINSIVNAIVFSCIYSITYLYVLKRIKIIEVDIFMNKILRPLKLKW